MYNKRLKITPNDYKRFETILNRVLSQPECTLADYLKIAQDKGYSKTRIVFDVYHACTFWLNRDNQIDYTFVRELTRRDYLNDASLESALVAILKDMKTFNTIL